MGQSRPPPGWGVTAGFLIGLGAVGAAERLVIDHFDDGALPNALGGDYGTWNRYPEDVLQGCQERVDAVNALGGKGYALRIDYDVDSPHPAYCGFWSRLPHLDLRLHQRLTLSLKGDATAGYTTQVKVELKGERLEPSPDGGEPQTVQEVGQYLLTGITDQWQPFPIPLEAFEGLSDRSRLTELVMLFDDMTSTKKTGVLYLDEIAFE